jgi:hypothetical protein
MPDQNVEGKLTVIGTVEVGKMDPLKDKPEEFKFSPRVTITTDGEIISESSAVINKDLTVKGKITSNDSVTIEKDLTVKGKINEGHTWYEVLPKGMIMMWHGDGVPVPNGWVICDGNNNTPDLRGRFVMGTDDKFGIYSTTKDTLQKAIKAYNDDADNKNNIPDTKEKHKHWEQLSKDDREKENSVLSKQVLAAEKEYNNAHLGGSPSMIKKKNISGSGLDMSKAEYVSEIDYPPFMALYYIMKL